LMQTVSSLAASLHQWHASRQQKMRSAQRAAMHVSPALQQLLQLKRQLLALLLSLCCLLLRLPPLPAMRSHLQKRGQLSRNQ